MIAVGFALASCSHDDPAPAAPRHDAGTDAVLPQPTSTDPKVQEGWASVVARGCADCHQSPDASDGVLSGQSAPVPGSSAFGSNLTPDPDTGMDAWDAGSIVTAIRMGVDSQGQQLCPTMPQYATMGDDEAFAIAAYLQDLFAAHHAIPDSLCPPIKVADAGEPSDEAGDEASSDAGTE